MSSYDPYNETSQVVLFPVKTIDETRSSRSYVVTRLKDAYKLDKEIINNASVKSKDDDRI